MPEPAAHKLSHYFTHSKRKGKAGLPLASVTMNDGLVLRADMDRKMETSLLSEEHSLVEPGDIAYNMMRMWQGAFGLASAPVNVSPAYVVMRAKHTLDPRYAAQWLKSDRALYLLWAYSYGLTDDRLRLYPKEFLQIPVAWPDLPEQRRIAAVLDAWDEAIAACEKLVAAKERAEKSLFANLRKTWQEYEFASFGKLVGGGTPSKANPEFWKGSIPWVSSKDMGAGLLKATVDHISEAAVVGSSTKLVPAGAILMVVRSGILRHTFPVTLTDRKVAINQDIKALIPAKGFDGFLLSRIIRLVSEDIRRLSMKTGTTVESIDVEALKEFPLPYPSEGSKSAVSGLLKTLQVEIDTHHSRLAQYRAQKRGLMQKLLTGQWRVSERTEALLPGTIPA